MDNMRRVELQKKIAQLDEEINSVLASTELPKLDVRPFPIGTWLFGFLCLAWVEFGSRIPAMYSYHLETAVWEWRLGLVIQAVAFLSTLSWFFRGRGYEYKSAAYTEASRKVRDLQERRRDLQSELRGLTEN